MLYPIAALSWCLMVVYFYILPLKIAWLVMRWILLILGGHFRGVPWLVHRPTYLFFFIGGQLQVQEWMARSKKVWTPSSYWELGPSGNTVIDVSSMGLLLRFLVWFLPSKRSYTSGLLLGLEECHTSSPWVLMLFRSYGYSWSGLTPFYSVCNSF